MNNDDDDDDVETEQENRQEISIMESFFFSLFRYIVYKKCYFGAREFSPV
jgi:hypothetical protein